MSDVVIKAENLSKYYNLGVINNGTLFRDIQTWWALKRGKEDPHSQIGSHKYDATETGFWALKDLNFEIHQGDRIGIIGKNGAGKSTLLKLLSRITAPTEGNIKIKGRVASLLEVGTGFHAELTGRENIYLNGAILGMKRKEVDRKLDEIIAFSEIENHIDTPVKRYSSGMYVRLAFAVAAHLDSEILIADEVLAVGDATFQKKAIGKMNELSTGQGRTVLFVSHQMNAVRNLCNKGIILEKGRLLKQNESIDKCIDYYLGKGDDDLDTTFWVGEKQNKNRYLEVTSLKMVDEKNKLVTTKLAYDKDYFIDVELSAYDVPSNLLFGLSVIRDGAVICGMGIQDIKQLHIGDNHIQFKLAAKTLLPGNYELRVSSSIKNTEWIINPDSDGVIMTFIVDESKQVILPFIASV